MIDKSRLKAVLVKYKQQFTTTIWPDEKYKWEAIQCFQENWDIAADNFPVMLANALAKTNNLLASMNFYPRRMIEEVSEQTPEEVRAMFIGLFDESK
ncbi:MAG: hypothetical protein PHS67_07320, partial [Sphaerochaetaceae bacterium]|nr:hypothetical protein [Sphaerochaetaceae bacterium]